LLRSLSGSLFLYEFKAKRRLSGEERSDSMVSIKFKPGQRVYYISDLTDCKDKRYGVICPYDVAKKAEDSIPNNTDRRVWAYWGEPSDQWPPTYVLERLVYAAHPSSKRNLPSWF